MKKKLLLVLTTVGILGYTVTVNACTPRYKPISSNPNYKDYNKALDSVYKAGQNIKIKIDPKWFANIKINK